MNTPFTLWALDALYLGDFPSVRRAARGWTRNMNRLSPGGVAGRCPDRKAAESAEFLREEERKYCKWHGVPWYPQA